MPSSVLRRFQYHPDEKLLAVEFVSGRRYAYRGVRASVAAALRDASSKGAFFNRHIRDHFPFDREDKNSAVADRRPGRQTSGI